MNVSKLKLEDLYIIEEKPLRVRIGKRELFVKSLPLKEVDKFENRLADLLIRWRNHLQDIDILNYADLHNLKKIHTFTFLWKRKLKSNQRFLKDVCRLICKPYRFSVRYFMRHATYETVTQCFLATQLINYDAVKKNLDWLIIRAGIIQASPTLLTTSVESGDGQKSKHLTPRF
jgi:hypothetical protein